MSEKEILPDVKNIKQQETYTLPSKGLIYSKEDKIPSAITLRRMTTREDKLRLRNEGEDVIRKELLQLSGVGPKVADCIMLFSMRKFEVFPIDVWIRRVMIELYFGKEEKNKTLIPNNKQILEFAENKFEKLAGIAQQYLFYWRRELEK